jgi:hypothetical protein
MARKKKEETNGSLVAEFIGTNKGKTTKDKGKTAPKKNIPKKIVGEFDRKLDETTTEPIMSKNKVVENELEVLNETINDILDNDIEQTQPLEETITIDTKVPQTSTEKIESNEIIEENTDQKQKNEEIQKPKRTMQDVYGYSHMGWCYD